MRSFDAFLITFAVLAGAGGGLVLLVQFLSLRMRNTALPPDDRDPHLGRKFALGVFLHLGVMLLLTGLTVSFTDVFDELFGGGNNSGWSTTPTWRGGGPGGPGWGPPPPPPTKPWFNAQQRVAAGLMLSGLIHTVLFAMLMYFATNAFRFPAVSRAFVLNRLLVAGVILMAITTSFCVFLFSEESLKVESFGRIIGLAVVWGPAALGHFLWLMFGLNREKAKARQQAEMDRPREADRPRRDDDRPPPRRTDDDDRPPPRRRRDDD